MRSATTTTPTKRFHVTYFYLATGMEGNADTADYGYVRAHNEQEARSIAASRDYRPGTRDHSWVMGCLTAKEVLR